MIVSPRSSSGASLSTVSPTNAAGTIIHTWRGAARAPTNSSSDELPVIPSAVIVATASGHTS